MIVERKTIPLKDVAVIFGAKALRKLKHPSRSDKLRSFIDTL